MKNILFLLLFLPFNTFSQVVTTVAGTGIQGYNGDGMLAITSDIFGPSGVFVDKNHNVYFSDAGNYRIRKINTSGVITTIAGNGLIGYDGDNGPATSAKIRLPYGVFVDDTGNVYFTQVHNGCVRKISTSGIITTVVGTGVWGFAGDNGPATSALMKDITDVILDSLGNIYIADIGNERIRKVDTAGIITTIAGGGSVLGDGGPATSAQLTSPIGITIDKLGNLFIAESGGYRIRKVDNMGIITTIAGTGIGGYNGDNIPATAAQIGARDVAVDNKGNVYISEGGDGFTLGIKGRIRKIDAAGIITNVAGYGVGGFNGDYLPPLDTKFTVITSITFDGLDIYISDENNNRIRKIANFLDVGTTEKQMPSISMYPNPSNGKFSISIEGLKMQIVTIIITNVWGKEVQKFDIKTNSIEPVNLVVPSGVYFIKASTEHFSTTNKLTIVK